MGLWSYLFGIAYDEDDYLMHEGVAHDENPPGRGSGRYAFGSGEDPFEKDHGLMRQVALLKKQGISETEIAKGFGFKSTFELRAALSIEANDRKKYYKSKCPELRDQGYTISQIAEKLGISSGTVHNYLDQDRKIQIDRTTNVANMLKAEVDKKRFIDVGPGVDIENGISEDRMKTAVEMLKQQGYERFVLKVPQLGNPKQLTAYTVLGAPGTKWTEILHDTSLIKSIQDYAVDNGKSILNLEKPVSIDSSRIFVRYAEDGGQLKDGLIELRRGVEDISLGKSSYAQVRIGVDDKAYMKGMARYSDDIPEGYDVVYNSKKHEGADFYDVFKEMKKIKGTEDPDVKGSGEIDWDNPFGAAIKAGGQSHCLDKNGMETDKLRVINKVNEEGDWLEWSRTVSPQLLAKQGYSLIRSQLELTVKDKRLQLDEIMALENPTVKKKMLEDFASDCDSNSYHLKALQFPGQGAHAIMPLNTIGDDKVYAPNYPNGTKIACVRFPHGHISEIPILTVDNTNAEARACMKNAKDAIGISFNTADRMSGADFDGDTVVCIPTTHTKIENMPKLKQLIGFDTSQYEDKNVPLMSSHQHGLEMGKTTNLLQDMQILGADPDEVAMVLRHSMVVVDCKKHHLDWKQSEIDCHIQEMKDRYQGGGGASTVITRAKAEAHRPETKYGSIVDEDGTKHYMIDPATGKEIIVPTGRTVEVYKPTKKDPDRRVTKLVTESVHTMETVDDARELMSSQTNPHPKEVLYAEFANAMKSMANEARKAMVNTPGLKRNPEATKKYAKEVAELDEALTRSLLNLPRERQALAIGNANYRYKLNQNPDLKDDKEACKKLRSQCQAAARLAVGAKKQYIEITDSQLEAIQAGAISETKLKKILENSDIDSFKQKVMPKNNKSLDASRTAQIKALAASGWTQAMIAEHLGISATTVNRVLD